MIQVFDASKSKKSESGENDAGKNSLPRSVPELAVNYGSYGCPVKMLEGKTVLNLIFKL